MALLLNTQQTVVLQQITGAALESPRESVRCAYSFFLRFIICHFLWYGIIVVGIDSWQTGIIQQQYR